MAAPDVDDAAAQQLLARACTNQWSADDRFTSATATAVMRTILQQLQQGVDSGEVVPGSFATVMQMVQRNPQMLTSLTGFARHWHDVGAKTEERTEETRELMQVMSHGYCIASALQRLGQGVDGYVVAVEQGGSGIERAAQSEQSVIVVTQALVAGLAARRYRRRNGVLYQEHRHGGVATRAWVPVIEPRTRQHYAIQDYVHFQTSLDVNPDLHELLRGHVSGGDVKQVVEGLVRSEHRLFPHIQPYEHAFSFTDGIYIGFLPRVGAFAGAEYDALWAAVRAREIPCISNLGLRAHGRAGGLAHGRRVRRGRLSDV